VFSVKYCDIETPKSGELTRERIMSKMKKVWIGIGVAAVVAVMVIANLSMSRKKATTVESQKVEERELRALVRFRKDSRQNLGGH
jgi:hypothetical protein